MEYTKVRRIKKPDGSSYEYTYHVIETRIPNVGELLDELQEKKR